MEGLSDGPVLQTFWAALAKAGDVKSLASLGVDIINCEDAANQPQLARIRHEGPGVSLSLLGEASCALVGPLTPQRSPE